MAERWNPLDLGKLNPDSKGLLECMAWGIESAKVLVEIIQDLNRSEGVDPEETNRNRFFYLCLFMNERLNQIDSFMERLTQKLINEESRKARATICTAEGFEAVLTTDHLSSRYGIPVLLVNDFLMMPDTVLFTGITAGDLVKRFLDDQEPVTGTWGERTYEAVKMAEVYHRTADMFYCEDVGTSASAPAPGKSA